MAAQLLPDVELMKQSHQNLAENIGRFQNLPAFGNGAAIIAALDDLRQGMQAMNTRLDHVAQEIDALRVDCNILRVDLDNVRGDINNVRGDINNVRGDINNVHEDIARMNASMLAERHNAIARVQNNSANNRYSTLMPLRNVITNAPIPHFPPTSAALRSLNNAHVTDILDALGLPTDGLVLDKQMRLRVASGIAQAIE